MRLCVLFVAVCAAGFAGTATEAKPVTITGKLVERAGKPPALETADHHFISLDGDKGTKAVLNDKRLDGFDMVAKGHFTGPDQFQVDPIYKHAMFVRKDGHLKIITYWCSTCSIRYYTPGKCWCCQRETTLDLRDPGQDQ